MKKEISRMDVEELKQDSQWMEYARREYALQMHPKQFLAFERISILIDEVRRCWSDEDYRIAQQHLGEHIEQVDSAVEGANISRARAEKQIRRLRRKNMPPETEAFIQAQASVRRAELERELYLRLGRQYRTVGDALAWQFYGFRALPIYALGMNVSPGIISHSKQGGAAAEVEVIEKLWREKRLFALRHDYTNCLRIADLSVLYPDHPDIPDFLEIKAGGRRATSGQKKRGREAIELVRHQVMTRSDGTVLVHRAHARRSLTDQPETTLEVLQRALMRARTELVGSASNTYLAIKAVDMTVERSQEQSIQVWQRWNEIPPEIETPRCEDYLVGESYQKMTQVGFGAPYSIYPLPPSYAAGLITGFLRVHVYLNTAAVTQALERAGFETECLLSNLRLQGQQPSRLKGDTDYFRLRRGAIMILISSSPLGQILFEGLPLEDFVASLEEHNKVFNVQESIFIPGLPIGRARRSHMLSTYTDMEQVWRLSREFVGLDEEYIADEMST